MRAWARDVRRASSPTGDGRGRHLAVHRRRLLRRTSTASRATTACATSSPRAASTCPTGDPDDPPAASTVCGLGNRKNDAFNDGARARRRRRPTPGRSRCSTTCASAGCRWRSCRRSAQRPGRARGRRARRPVRGPSSTAGSPTELGLPGKPAPDTFLHAAAALGATAGRAGRRRGRRLGRPRRGAPAASGWSIGVDRGAGADDPARRRRRPRRRRPRRAGRRVRRGMTGQRTSGPTRSTAAAFPVDPWRAGRDRPTDPTTSASPRPCSPSPTATSACAATPRRAATPTTHGTFVNGFHETWPIRHAEAAFGFARTGQTIVNVPDAKVMKLYVDDEPLDLRHRRPRALRAHPRLPRRRARAATLVWRTPTGKRVRVDSDAAWCRSTQRHLAVHHPRGDDARRRRPGRRSPRSCSTARTASDEYHAPAAAWASARPAQGRRRSTSGCCCRGCATRSDDRMLLGYRCAHSGMTLAVAADHTLDDAARARRRPHQSTDDLAKTRLPGGRAARAAPSRLTKTGRLPLLARRAGARAVRPVRPHARPGARGTGVDALRRRAASAWFADFWAPPTSRSSRGPARGPAGGALEPVPARAGVGRSRGPRRPRRRA